ncbi:MAG: potassium channel family protein [Hyphomicrobiaceae bacterium]
MGQTISGDERGKPPNAARDGFKGTLRKLYFGKTVQGRVFRFCLLAIDIAFILFFIFSSLVRGDKLIIIIDIFIAIVILADFIARLWLSENKPKFFGRMNTWIDIVVIVTLLLPAVIESFLFLRVLRALRLLRSYHVLSDLRDQFAFFRRNEEIIQSVINLLVFIFIMTALVYVMQVRFNPKISNYIDALYFTVTTLTTTGFGDITLEGTSGRLLSVAIMIVGFALFLRLVQTIFRPSKVAYVCPDCGLKRHDPDAVHCKHCGRVIHIGTEGE